MIQHFTKESKNEGKYRNERLRGVETGIAELQGRKSGFSVPKDWIVASCAVAALIVSIIALTS